ncbi:MAG TPA: cytochrome c peroxidase [Planctomycetota bacterium]
MMPAQGQGYRCVRSWRPSLVALALSAPVLAAQEPPRADFTTNPSPARAEERLLVQFLDRSTGTVTAWSWDFGDGARSSEPNPTHLYLFGNFDVTLTVSGPGGSSSFTLDSAVEVVGIPPSALSTMRVPRPAQLAQFVVQEERAVELGKALFWDVQLGSDGLTACASCHYHAGADNRPRNTLHPGANGTFERTLSGLGGGANTALNAGDFPFVKYRDPLEGLNLLAASDDVRGASGVLRTVFSGLDAGSAVDLGQDQDDGLFEVAGADTTRVTGRDAPTAIGAIFFHRLFWDGRANHFFNGRNIWGNADPSAPKVLEQLGDGSLGEVAVLLDNAAAASQAVGPPLSDVEMSWAGRSWPDLGRKLLARRPLASQAVSPGDGVLGALAHLGGPGLAPGLTYAEMVRAAFDERWWGSAQLTPDGFTQMEANFALFFGLAIQLYEATLIPDEAPYDRFRRGDAMALSPREQEGLSLFLGRGRCITCHDTPMFAGALRDEVVHNSPDEGEGLVERMIMANSLAAASVTFATTPGAGELPLTFNPYRRAVTLRSLNPALVLATTTLPSGQRCPPAGQQVFDVPRTEQVSPTAQFGGQVRIESDGQCGFRITVSFEWNVVGPSFYEYELEIGGQRFPLLIAPASRQAVYDNGFYNLGVRPTEEDLGVGGNGPFGPLALTRRSQNGEDLGQPNHGGAVVPGERVAVNGAFKTPTLRNVELTGPYMHNGSMATLEQVVEFYARAGDFEAVNWRDKDIDVAGFGLSQEELGAIVAFLKTLTDPRVRFEQAPFDHPELPLKTGHVGDHESAAADGLGNALLELDFRPATGAEGGPPIPAFIERLDAALTVVKVFETSGLARVALICDKPPTQPVRIRLRSSDEAVATVTPAEVVFTPEEWRLTHTVDVTRVDGLAGPAAVRLETSRAQSLDHEFHGLVVPDIELDFVPDSTPASETGSSGPTAPRFRPEGTPRPLR